MDKVRIGTRGSRLALWQANWIRERLKERYPGLKVELVRIRTSGDRIKDVPLAKIGGKGLFVKEIEGALLDGRVDLAVHSMKDVPTELPQGLHIAAITEREDPRDVLISRTGEELLRLRKGARIGTSSLRRQIQILRLRPDIKVEPLRGNLDTRLRKLEEGGHFDAIIVALAGLKRMGWDGKATELLPPELLLPAIGQGAIGIETRSDDQKTNGLISFLDHEETSIAVKAERTFLKRLEGGCQVPIAAYGTLKDGKLYLRGLVGSIDGSRVIEGEVSGAPEEWEELGIGLAEDLLRRGGREILKEVYREGERIYKD